VRDRVRRLRRASTAGGPDVSFGGIRRRHAFADALCLPTCGVHGGWCQL